MQKITLLLSANHRETALEKLRELGVLHIKYIQNPQSEDIDFIKSEMANIEKALQIIEKENESQKNVDLKSASPYVKQILDLVQEKKNLVNELAEHRDTLQWFETWGRISYASIKKLKDAGIFVRFYRVDKNALRKLSGDKNIYIVKEEQGTTFIAFFAESPEDRLNFKEEQIPEVELDYLESRITEIEERIKKIGNELKNLSEVRNCLSAYKVHLKKQLEFNNVMHSMGDEEHFVYLQGFCPKEYTDRVKKTAHREGWAYFIQEPDDPNEVPTLIRNPKWLRIINPLFKFMGTLPGYNEYDISFWFLFFFSLFFAILIGDAGYGFVFLGLTIFASKKAKNIPEESFRLLYVLSGATIFWGCISGTWFGFERIVQLSFLNSLVIDQVNSFAKDNQLFMMYLCFVIGIIHLSIAHIIKAFKVINSPVAFSEVGWIAILWTLFFVAGKLVIGKPIPGFIGILFVVGVLLTLIFSNFQKNILKGIGVTLGDVPLNIISSFSDIVSYLRLFAVSYASVTVAASFNEMAVGTGVHSVVGGFLAAMVLCMGHALNILLGLMSVIVHGIRLNMLEFSGHLNMQWAGKGYKPFKK